MWLKTVTFVIWAAVAGTSVFWSLRLFAQPSGEAAKVPVAPPSAAPSLDWGPVLGRPSTPTATAAPALASRLKLIGLAGSAREGTGVGVALLSLDGQPPKPYAVGAVIEGELVVLEIAGQSVRIGPRGGAAVLTLQATLLPAAATSTTPPYAALPSPQAAAEAVAPTVGPAGPGAASAPASATVPATAPAPAASRPPMTRPVTPPRSTAKSVSGAPSKAPAQPQGSAAQSNGSPTAPAASGTANDSAPSAALPPTPSITGPAPGSTITAGSSSAVPPKAPGIPAAAR